MKAPLAARAVVIGAGIGGLTAAKAIAPYFAQVLVLERDALPDEPSARAGVPQGRQMHGLLPGGLIALETLFPGFRADLESAGAARVRCVQDFRIERPGYDPFPQRDFGYDIFSLSRPLLERLCRRRLEAEPNVEVRPRCRVVGLTPTQTRPPAVCGVEIREPDGGSRAIAADLVIDASGRGSPTLAFLETMGLRKPEETEIKVGIAYASIQLELPNPPARLEHARACGAPSVHDEMRVHPADRAGPVDRLARRSAGGSASGRHRGLPGFRQDPAHAHVLRGDQGCDARRRDRPIPDRLQPPPGLRARLSPRPRPRRRTPSAASTPYSGRA